MFWQPGTLAIPKIVGTCFTTAWPTERGCCFCCWRVESKVSRQMEIKSILGELEMEAIKRNSESVELGVSWAEEDSYATSISNDLGGRSCMLAANMLAIKDQHYPKRTMFVDCCKPF